jgi:enoyl-CoA hydratase/carnithine racemase
MVRYERRGGVAIIRLSRSPLNTYDDWFHVQFQRAWQTAASDDSRVVVLLAEGPHFCAGAELKAPLAAPPGSEILSPWEEIRLIKSVMKPTIAAVHKGCVGGGQRMAWPCDLIFCTEDAFFRDPTASMGLGGIQSHLHTWFYGPRLAKEMIYTGMRLEAKRLYAMGQVNRLFSTTEELHAGALKAAAEIAEIDPIPLRQGKRAVDTTLDIQGQHYVLSRMAELMDEPARFALPSL